MKHVIWISANKTYHSTLILKDGLKESINSTLNPTEQYENEPFYYISKDLKFILNQIYRLKLRNVVNLYARMHLTNSGIPEKNYIFIAQKRTGCFDSLWSTVNYPRG